MDSVTPVYCVFLSEVDRIHYIPGRTEATWLSEASKYPHRDPVRGYGLYCERAKAT